MLESQEKKDESLALRKVNVVMDRSELFMHMLMHLCEDFDDDLLQDAMDYFSTGDARASKSREIQDELARTKGTMFKNIDQALQRGEKIDVLVDKTDTLAQQSGQFKRKATAIKRGYRCQNIKMMAICGGMIVTLSYVVISSSTGKWNPGQWFGGK